eukprot:1182368-Prorocentrum_minimum.AAC.2
MGSSLSRQASSHAEHVNDTDETECRTALEMARGGTRGSARRRIADSVDGWASLPSEILLNILGPLPGVDSRPECPTDCMYPVPPNMTGACRSVCKQWQAAMDLTVTHLKLRPPCLHSEVPRSLERFPRLTELHLRTCYTLPASWLRGLGALPCLRGLHVSRGCFVAEMLEAVGSLTNLTALSLTQMSEMGDPEMRALTALTALTRVRA